MNITERELDVGFRRRNMSSIRGDRTRHNITFNPNKASPGEDLYIDIPKFKPSSNLVPGSLHLVFDFEVAGTKTHFMNNLSKILQRRLQIRLAGEAVYDCGGESLYSTYKDLWMSRSERKDMVEYGTTNQNMRKLISGRDDSGATTGDTQKVSDALMFSMMMMIYIFNQDTHITEGFFSGVLQLMLTLIYIYTYIRNYTHQSFYNII